VKDTLTVGDTLDFTTSVPGYPASSGYTLKYRVIPRTSGAAILLTATAVDDDYRVQYPPAVTATWAAGEYTWSAWIEKSGERYSVDSGIVTLKVDPAVVAAYDGRTPARAALDAANAALAGYGNEAFSHVSGYTIGNRSMQFREFRDQGDFLAFRSQLKAEVWREDAAVAMAAGLPNPRQIRVRFSRA
jgi:hypothetical protein